MIFIMSLFFVNCERTVLFSVKRDLDPPPPLYHPQTRITDLCYQSHPITTPRTSCIYFLPRIHIHNNPGRLIVSLCNCPTELISSYLDKIMAPIVKSLPSYVKDSRQALQATSMKFFAIAIFSRRR